jgi:hypothetical protein
MNFTPTSFLGGSKPLICTDVVGKNYSLLKTAAIPGEWTAQYMNPMTMTYCTVEVQSATTPRRIVAVPNTVTYAGGDSNNVTIIAGSDASGYVCPQNLDLCVGQQYQIVVSSGIAIVGYFDTGSCGFVCRADSINSWLPGTYYLDAISGSVVIPSGSTISAVGSPYTTACAGC